MALGVRALVTRRSPPGGGLLVGLVETGESQPPESRLRPPAWCAIRPCVNGPPRAILDRTYEGVPMSREARPGERLPILRALATCVARDVPLRIWDESRAGCLRLVVEGDRAEFYRALRVLLDRVAEFAQRSRCAPRRVTECPSSINLSHPQTKSESGSGSRSQLLRREDTASECLIPPLPARRTGGTGELTDSTEEILRGDPADFLFVESGVNEHFM